MKKGLAIATGIMLGALAVFLFRSVNAPSTVSPQVTNESFVADTPNNPANTRTADGTHPDSTASGIPGLAQTRPENPTPAASLAGNAGQVPDTTGEPLPNLTPGTVMENMRSAIRQYGSRFGGNPVGTNPEITKALNGDNPKQVKFLNPQNGMRVNGKGELIDPWGTPFFFHQLSGTEMEIHSAGPDKIMWTADDLVIK